MHKNLVRLQGKFDEAGQNLASHLEGLFYAEYQRYWEYVRLDTLLSLQSPRTDFADEMVFIVYHQITELYFKLILWELEQITTPEPVTAAVYLQKLERINLYYRNLIQSFDITVKGIDHEQFMKFRTTLTPASGFQSVQYRLIELHITDLQNLVSVRQRPSLSGEETTRQLLEKVYWKEGAIDVKTGGKDLSLVLFEKKYSRLLLRQADECRHVNLWQQFRRHQQDSPLADPLVEALKRLDKLANVEWPLVHYKTVVRHLQRGKETSAATGGTNWKKYLPPRYRKIIYFPELWSEAEVEEWGTLSDYEALFTA